MATYKSSKDSKGYTLILEVTQKSQDITNNKSVVSWALKMSNDGARFSTSSNKITVSINGTKVKDNVTTAIDMTDSYTQTITIYSGTATITHNADGSKSIAVSASFTPSSTASYMPTSKSLSGTFALTTIPRASSVTATDSNIESATSINISRASNSFTHNLSYSFEGLTGTIATGIATSYGWTIPTSFYAKIPNAQSATCTVTCDTYNGSTKIGSKTTTFKVSVDVEKNRPEVSATIADVNAKTLALTGNENKLIKYFSNVSVSLTATAKNNATISSKNIVCGDGKTLTEDGVINAVESGKFTANATDSRKISGSESYTLEMIDYIKLTLNPTFYRTQPTNGEVGLKYNGNYFNDTFGAVANTLNLKYRYKIKGSDDNSWSAYTTLTPVIKENTYSNGTEPIIIGSNFDYKKEYVFEIVATDKIYSNDEITITQTIHEGKPIVNWNKTEFDVNVDLKVEDKNNEENKINVSERMSYFPPIGFVHISTKNTHPSTIYGVGEWKQIKDVFLLCAGDTYAIGTTGGSAEVTLTTEQMPSHTHTISSSGGHSHTAKFKEQKYPTSGASRDFARKQSTTDQDSTAQVTVSNGAHTHTPANTGGGQAHNNMPPYQTVYAWERIS